MYQHLAELFLIKKWVERCWMLLDLLESSNSWSGVSLGRTRLPGLWFSLWRCSFSGKTDCFLQKHLFWVNRRSPGTLWIKQDCVTDLPNTHVPSPSSNWSRFLPSCVHFLALHLTTVEHLSTLRASPPHFSPSACFPLKIMSPCCDENCILRQRGERGWVFFFLLIFHDVQN